MGSIFLFVIVCNNHKCLGIPLPLLPVRLETVWKYDTIFQPRKSASISHWHYISRYRTISLNEEVAKKYVRYFENRYIHQVSRERDAHVSCCRRMWLRVIDLVAAESGGDVCGTVESRSDAITSSTKSAARGDEVSERDTRYGFGCRRRASSVAVAAATPPSVRRRIACTECDVGGRLFACSAAGECFARRRSCSAESPRRRRRRRALTGLTPPSAADRRRAANFRRRTAVIGAPVAANYARRRR